MAEKPSTPLQEKRLLSFGPFGVDPLRRVLTRNQEPVALTPKALDILLVLIERRGEIVDKDELMEAVWPGVVVEENNLARTISSLRKALGETVGENQYIVTVPGRGYTFVAPVTGYVGEAEPPPESVQPRLRIPPWRFVGFAACAAAVVTAAVVYTSFPRNTDQAFAKTEMIRVTDAGESTKAVISPDAHYVAYVRGNPGQQSLWIRQISAMRSAQLVPPSGVYYAGLAFSPDSTNIYYATREHDASDNKLFRIPVLGGPAEPLLQGIDSPISFSPDGSRFAFVREEARAGTSSVLSARPDGSGVETLATRKLSEYYDYPAWSPDGKRIACILVKGGPQVEAGLVEIPLDSRKERQIGATRWGYAAQMHWLSDRSLVISARTRESGLFQLWQVTYPAGEARRITSGLVAYLGVSASRDGKTLVSIQDPQRSSIWIAPVADTARAAEAISGTVRNSIFSWMPDGRLLFEKNLSGHRGLWILPAGGGEPGQSTTEGDCWYPAVSPDGRYFVCTSDRSGTPGVWLESMDGRERRELVKGTGETFPQWTPDGAWAVYAARMNQIYPSLWKAPVGGGPTVPLSDLPFERAAVSPDGKWVAGFSEDGPPGMKRELTKIAVIPIEGGRPIKLFPIAQSVFRDAGLHWTPDGAGLSYLDNRDSFSNIWKQPLTGGPPVKITDWRGERILYFDWSRDGKYVAFSREGQGRDIVLIRDVR